MVALVRCTWRRSLSCLVLLGRPVFGALRRVVHGGFRARDAALHGFRVRSRYCTLRSCSWDTDEVPTLMKCLQWSSGCGVFGHPHAGSKFVSKSSQERLKERTSFRMLRLRAWLLRLCLKSTAGTDFEPLPPAEVMQAIRNGQTTAADVIVGFGGFLKSAADELTSQATSQAASDSSAAENCGRGS